MTTPDSPTAVVIGLGINALSIVRSLGRRGINVIAIGSNFSDYAANSRYCKKLYCPNLSEFILIETLAKIGSSFKDKAVLFCTTDQSVLLVSQWRDHLTPYYSFVYPTDKIIKTLMSKQLCFDFSLRNQFAVPNTHFFSNIRDFENLLNRFNFPCVLKPDIRDDRWEGTVGEKVLYLASKHDFLQLSQRLGNANQPVILQEWIEGEDNRVYFCLAYIDRKGQPLGVITGRKIRQYPPGTGSTSLAETISEPTLTSEAIRFFKKSGCKGLCSVEFKRSSRDNRLYITEPTIGRTDLQEGLASSAGLDLTYIAYLDAIGCAISSYVVFRKGIKWVNEPSEVYYLQNHLKKNLTNCIDFLSSYAGRRSFALYATDDIGPFLRFVADKVSKGTKKTLSSLRLPLSSVNQTDI
jgi:predicted ATP-grasp superfamily ATP-dependent carboligase